MATDLGFVSLTTQVQKLAQTQQNQNPNHGMWIWNTKQMSLDTYDDSWEVRAFAEDAGSLMGMTWPPRSYTCTFCRREFRSAQALGGHMNVHRRDRARLNQTKLPSIAPPSSLMIPDRKDFVPNGGGLCMLYQFPNPNSIFSPSNITSHLDSPSTLLSISPHSSTNPSLQFPSNFYPNQAETPTSKSCQLSNTESTRTKEHSTEELDLELRL